MKVDQGRQWLAARGLNLFAVLDPGRLPGAFLTAVRAGGVALEDYSRLVMIGHAGNLMWQRLEAEGMSSADPVDEYSERCAGRFVREFLGGCGWRLLYPGDLPIPLQQLGSAAGWHHDSPLGIGVNSAHGSWFGYRVVLLVKAEIPVSVHPSGTSPCINCTDKPCISTCPARALSSDTSPDIRACIGYRVGDGSQCAFTCRAREACPAGDDHRYVEQQVRYFYGRSLDSIKAYI